MKSIKEKACKHDWHCGGYDEYDAEDLEDSFKVGANYVLEQIVEAIRPCDNDRKTDLYKSLWDCIDGLRK